MNGLLARDTTLSTTLLVATVQKSTMVISKVSLNNPGIGNFHVESFTHKSKLLIALV
jgi:hypothetical protein